jgi:hypothetical protein
LYGFGWRKTVLETSIAPMLHAKLLVKDTDTDFLELPYGSLFITTTTEARPQCAAGILASAILWRHPNPD